MKVWVVMKCQSGSDSFWAWCRPNPDAPGFDNIFYTHTDGYTAYDPGITETPALRETLFVVTFPEEAQVGSRFPDVTDDPDDAGSDHEVAPGVIELTRTIPEGTALEVVDGNA